MKLSHIKKFIIILLINCILLDPFAQLFTEKVQATADSNAALAAVDSDSGLDIDGGDSTPVDSVTPAVKAFGDIVQTTNDNIGNGLSFSENMYGVAQSRLILNVADLNKIRALNCIASLTDTPDFENDLTKLFNILPLDKRPTNEDELLKIKIEDPTRFRELVRQAMIAWGLQVPDFANDLSLMAKWIKDDSHTYTETELAALKSKTDAISTAKFTDLIKNAQDNWLANNSTDYKKLVDQQITALKALKQSQYAVMPSFETDMEAILEFLPVSSDNPKTVTELGTIKNSNSTKYYEYVDMARNNWVSQQVKTLSPDFENDYAKIFSFMPAATDNPKSVDELKALKNSNRTKFDTIAKGAKMAFMNYITWTSAQSSKSVQTLSCISNLSVNELINANDEYLASVVTTALDATVIDLRVLKALVYLVTPKDQGGAGHWRIRVRRLTQLATTPYSTESETLRTSLGGVSARSAQCDSTMTAAECGQKQDTAAMAENENVTVEDKDGESYYASLTTTDSAGNLVDKVPERNISAHVDGKAIDIVEVDSIKCTLVKKRRIGGTSTEKKVDRPIKLAWQTAQGYKDSGGNSTDMMGIMKSLAQDSVLELIGSMNGDVTEYSDDLTKADFNDITGIIGKALFSQLLNSPDHNLEGFSVEDTISKLGSMYLADSLGLPREVFLNNSISSLEDVQTAIGQAAIETKLGLPFGSLSSYNPIKSRAPQATTDEDGDADVKPVYDLEGLLINTGMRKLEKEMGLRVGDLNEYISKKTANNSQGGTNQYTPVYIGLRLIENAINMAQGSLKEPGNNYNEFKKNIGETRAKVLFIDPTWMDTYMHLEKGTTTKLKDGTISPSDYVASIGQARIGDTMRGFAYFQANVSALNLPTTTYPIIDASGAAINDSTGKPKTENVWEHALKGYTEAYVEIGLHYLALSFADSTEFSAQLGKDNNLIPSDWLTQLDAGTISIQSDPKDLGVGAFKAWVRDNLTSTNCALPAEGTKVTKELNNITISRYAAKSNVRKTDLGIADATGLGSYNNGALIDSVNNVSMKFEIKEYKAQQLGLNHQDLFRIFGCSSSRTNQVSQRIGSRMLYTAIANKYLGGEENIKIDLKETDPNLRFTNPQLQFYISRYQLIKSTLNTMKNDWSKETSLKHTDIDEHINNILGQISGDLSNTADIKNKGNSITHELELLQDDIRYAESKANSTVGLINKTLSSINTILHAASEILQGTTIPMSETLTLSTISLNSGTSSSSAGSGGSANSNGLTGVPMAAAIFDFLNRRIAATDLFIMFGAGKAENELNLPPRTLVYLVQNYEKIGYSGSDALYAALGQAKIEQQFSLPAYYFQGDQLAGLPNWKTDYAALEKYAGSDLVTQYRNYTNSQILNNTDGITEIRLFPNNRAYLKSLARSKDNLQSALYLYLLAKAKKAWQDEYSSNLQTRGGHVTLDTTLDRVAVNVANRKYNDAIRSGDKDVLMRLGLSGELAGLRNNFNSIADQQAKVDDKKLEIREGSTKALITNQAVRLSNGESILDNDEKNLVTANVGIGADELTTYLKLINGDIPISQVRGMMTEANYTEPNPYYQKPADTADSCPIDYVIKDTDKPVGLGNFVVNEKNVQADSFCVYDKKGTHCLQSREEANRYRIEHLADQYTDVTESIAGSLAKKFPNYFNGGTEFEKMANARNKILDFIEGKTNSILSAEQLNEIKSSGDNKVLGEALQKILERKVATEPVLDYKVAVGKVEAKKLLSWQIFSKLGINVPTSVFDAGDFYSILKGDYRSLYRIGSYYIDQSLDLKPGTTDLIITAANPDNLRCALANAGASILGSVTGLGNVPIRGSGIDGLYTSIGEAQVEKLLGLPSGSFRGKSMNEVITRIKPLSFAVAFKIPVSLFEVWSYDDLYQIMGKNAERIKNSTPTGQLSALLEFLNANPALTATGAATLKKIDDYTRLAIAGSLDLWAKGQMSYDNVDIGVAPDNTQKQEIKNFVSFVQTLDKLFDIRQYATADLFKGTKMDGTTYTPDDYLKEISARILAKRFTADIISKLLGWDDSRSAAAANLALNYKKFFTCNSYAGSLTGTPGACTDPYYHNWAMMYDNLTAIFQINLDDIAGLSTGSFRRILQNPSHAYLVLMENTATQLDNNFGLEGSLSFSALYKRYATWEENKDQYTLMTDTKCLSESQQAYPGFDYNALMLRKRSNSEAVAVGSQPSATIEQKQASINAQADTILIDQQIKTVQDSIVSCQVSLRSSKGFDLVGNAYQLLQDDVSKKVHDAIFNIEINGERVGVDMPIADIREMVFKGDMRYFEIAGMAMAANYVQMQILGSDPKKSTVPAGMRITYYDIKMAFFPDQAMLNEANGIAAWQLSSLDAQGMQNPETYPTALFGDICPPADFVESLATCTPGNFAKTPSGINNQILVATSQTYGYDAATAADKAAAANMLVNGTEAQKAAIASRASDIQDKQRQMARDSLQFRLMDQVLWGADQNVFPGFTAALMKGDGKVKAAAMARYVVNGIKNGKIFGIKFDAMPDIETWLPVLNLGKQLIEGVGSEQAFQTFVTSGGFQSFSGLVSKNSEKWFGVYLEPGMIGGLLVGTFTGTWGKLNPFEDSYYSFSAGGKDYKVQTLGNAVKDWGLKKLFSWADKALGMDAGTAYQVFSLSKEVYQASVAAKAVNLAKGAEAFQSNLQKMSSAALEDLTSAAGITEKVTVEGKEVVKGISDYSKLTPDQKIVIQKFQADLKVAQAQVALISFVATYFIDKWFAKSMAKLEESLGLVPGSLSMLVNSAVGVGVAALVGSWSSPAVAAHLMSSAMSGLYIGIAIFIMMNLFGVYKTELKCTADNYWPEINSPPSSAVSDISGMKVWNGLNNKTMEINSIDAARYKARRLIIDMLNAHENPLYADIIPSQIMTGRQEDVDFTNVLIEQWCDINGMTSVGGICNGDTRAGVWANPDTIAWTHIGF